MERFCIFTIVDSIEPTSMPVNEFVIYRAMHNYPFRQIMIVCTEERYNGVIVPDNVRVFFVGHSRNKMKAIVKKNVEECKRNQEQFVFHLHSQTSALLFYSATLFMDLWKHTLYTIHSTYSSRDWKYRMSSCLCSLMAEYANCVSYSAYAEYAKWVRLVKGYKMMAIQNGVDYDRILTAVAALPNHLDVADIHKLVCVGRMIPIKNQQFLVKLMKHLPDTQLILIGKEDEKIRCLAKDEGVADRVVITGLLPRDDVFRQLNECGIYVSASLVEGMPVSVQEAMSMGLIPVLSDIAPHEEVAKGCLLIHTTPLVEEEWVKKIKEYQSLTEIERRNLSTFIVKSIKDKFSLEMMHKQYNNIYKKLAK